MANRASTAEDTRVLMNMINEVGLVEALNLVAAVCASRGVNKFDPDRFDWFNAGDEVSRLADYIEGEHKL